MFQCLNLSFVSSPTTADDNSECKERSSSRDSRSPKPEPPPHSNESTLKPALNDKSLSQTKNRNTLSSEEFSHFYYAPLLWPPWYLRQQLSPDEQIQIKSEFYQNLNLNFNLQQRLPTQ